jgi:predicted metal-binding membrane protein
MTSPVAAVEEGTRTNADVPRCDLIRPGFVRKISGVAIGAVIVLTGLLLVSSMSVPGQGSVWHPQPHGAGLESWILLIGMWQAMMLAMMLPVMAPWLGLVAMTHASEPGRAMRAVILFAAGYFAAWLLYSLGAGSLQMFLYETGALDGRHAVTAPVGSAISIVAGAFQFTRLKRACLTHCRSPINYLLTRWRNGPPSALKIGVLHGFYCVGCCWALMAVTFAVGLMHLGWMSVLALATTAEQLLPRGALIARLIGIVLVGYGVGMVVNVWN